MRISIRSIVLLLLLCLAQARAAETGWLQDQQNSHARINIRAQAGNNMTRLLFQVEMEPGWKTYWRSPGEGGMPPAIQWDQKIVDNWYWPTPQLFEVSGLIIQGYHDRVTLPITLNGRPESVLSGTVRLPVCSQECTVATIPFHLDLNRPVNKSFTTDFSQAMRSVPTTSGLFTHLYSKGYSLR